MLLGRVLHVGWDLCVPTKSLDQSVVIGPVVHDKAFSFLTVQRIRETCDVVKGLCQRLNCRARIRDDEYRFPSKIELLLHGFHLLEVVIHTSVLLVLLKVWILPLQDGPAKFMHELMRSNGIEQTCCEAGLLRAGNCE
ncbi:hypothetical protein Mapa_014896 [Marchantia paleacea]|nr:hypothetical protein Mapa_014896 [Marchantia paleacea]